MREKEIVNAMAKIFPKKPLAISQSDLRNWSWDGHSTMKANGRIYDYGNRQLIPESLKIKGTNEYKPEIIQFLIRLRELQCHNLNIKEIKEIIDIEQKSRRTVALCRDCGQIFDYFVEKAESVCMKCIEDVVYNHEI